MITLRHVQRRHGVAGQVPFLRVVFGGMFVLGAAAHVFLVSARPGVYAAFADNALFGFVRTAWSDYVAGSPAPAISMLAFFECAVGLLVLFGNRRFAYVGAALMAAFHVALMTFGWGFWLWSTPLLALLGVLLGGLHAQAKQEKEA
jgi:hypothetical protein